MSLPPTCPSRESFECALEGTARALAGDPVLQLPAHKDDEHRQYNIRRGCCDAYAGKLRYHDVSLHRSLSPPGPLSAAIFDALEDLRVETVISREFSGVAINMAAGFENRLRQRGLNFLSVDSATPLANAAVLMVRDHLLGPGLPEVAVRLVGRWLQEITDGASNEINALLEGLRDKTRDQLAFAQCARRFIDILQLVDQPETDAEANPAEQSVESEETDEVTDYTKDEAWESDHGETESADTGSVEPGADEEQDVSGCENTGPENDNAETVISFPQSKTRDRHGSPDEFREGNPEEPDTTDGRPGIPVGYHAYTRRFDQIIRARDLLDGDRAKGLRASLDREIAEHRQLAVRIASRLQNSLRTLQKRSWTFDLDDGVLDTTRLSRLVVDPSSPLAFKQQRMSETNDTVVSFLVDNSGSMRGRPILLAAMFTELLAQTLERCHVSSEVLGFTTREWRGGQTTKQWREDGKPGNPGRLSDLRHVIYKAANDPWRRARQSLGVMLWPELLRENIDGEALMWACDRLHARPEQRRILVVISDGVPADDATLTNNSSDYLASHLRQAINWIETKSMVELLAVGIGQDISNVYKHSVTIKDVEQLGEALARELIELISQVPSVSRYPLVINR